MTKTVYAAIVRNERVAFKVVGDKLELPTYTLPLDSDACALLSGELSKQFGISRTEIIRKYIPTENTTTGDAEIYLIEPGQPLMKNGKGYAWLDTRDDLANVPFSLDSIATAVVKDFQSNRKNF